MRVSLFMVDAQMCILEDSKREDSNALIVRSDLDIIYSSSGDEEKDIIFVGVTRQYLPLLLTWALVLGPAH
jgi:hypothetical protein